ncbi:MAG: hypothetical protein ACRDRX_15550 [Pseudonocardiaceae bacterium]
MSQDAKPTNSPEESPEALSALRGIWQAQGQTSAALDEACGNTNICKSMESVGFQGLADDEAAKGEPSVGNNVRAAWKTKLEREGKLNTQKGSVRDLVFGPSEQNE